MKHVLRRTSSQANLAYMRDYDELLTLLIELRKSGGDTQASIAPKLGVGASTVGNWESKRAKVPFNTSVAWMRLYGHEFRVVPRALGSALFGEGNDEAASALARVAGVLATLDESALLDVEAIAVRLAPKDARKRA